MKDHDAVDREWIRAAVTRHEGPLTIYAARLLNDVERGRDVVQDTFLKLWQVERAAVDGHLARWLYTVCRNRALDVRRKERRMRRLENRPMEAAAAPDAGPGLARGTGEEGGVRAYLAALPERQREAVRLKFQGELSYREIAAVMDTTVNNVGVLLHTAIGSIRRRMAEASGAEAAPAPPAQAPSR